MKVEQYVMAYGIEHDREYFYRNEKIDWENLAKE